MASNKSVIQGSDVMLTVGSKPIGFATSHTLSITTETADISNKDFGNGYSSVLPTTISWECSCEAMYATDVYEGSATYAELLGYVTNKTEVTVVFGNSQNAGASTRTSEVDSAGGWVVSGVANGKGYITSLELNGANGEAATFSVTITGNGAIKAGAPSNG